MSEDYCVIYGNSQKKDPSAFFYRVRKEWISEFESTFDHIKTFIHVDISETVISVISTWELDMLC